jgi:hypothetical protein
MAKKKTASKTQPATEKAMKRPPSKKTDQAPIPDAAEKKTKALGVKKPETAPVHVPEAAARLRTVEASPQQPEAASVQEVVAASNDGQSRRLTAGVPACTIRICTPIHPDFDNTGTSVVVTGRVVPANAVVVVYVVQGEPPNDIVSAQQVTATSMTFSASLTWTSGSLALGDFSIRAQVIPSVGTMCAASDELEYVAIDPGALRNRSRG